ncbi:hypothetical protein ABZ858_31970 [Streptomyces sp. NPDC047017]|uniref:hypothetical protein n=1 Tax=Streptomyces sp. NPDC047017 TaxID=3155024 RepID=UPI0033C930E1
MTARTSRTSPASSAAAPRHLLVRAAGDGDSPLLAAQDPESGSDDLSGLTAPLPLDDPSLGLPGRLADRLSAWSRARPATGSAAREDVRRHAAEGLSAAQALARHLGPSWVVRYRDESHGTAKFLCWGCDRLHWSGDAHGTPPHPLALTVLGEYKWSPLRAEGFGDFAPDDPAAGLTLSDALVAELYTWSKDIDASMERYLNDRDEEADDARREELDRRGRSLAERVAHEAGPDRTVTYGGLA